MKFLLSLAYFILPSTPRAIEKSLLPAIVPACEMAAILPGRQPAIAWMAKGRRAKR